MTNNDVDMNIKAVDPVVNFHKLPNGLYDLKVCWNSKTLYQKEVSLTRVITEIAGIAGATFALYADPMTCLASFGGGAGFAFLSDTYEQNAALTVLTKSIEDALKKVNMLCICTPAKYVWKSYREVVSSRIGGTTAEMTILTVTGFATSFYKSTISAIATGFNAGQMLYRDIAQVSWSSANKNE